MEGDQKNKSTYGAIFAMMLIVLIIVGMAYNAIKKILNDRKEAQTEQAHKNIVVEGLPDNEQITPRDTILYENLTDEEAIQIIDRIRQSGDKNLKALKKLETEIAE